ncbi:MAG: ATP-binding protein [Bacteroidales bacterium]|jgi:DNA transposition AAA+ family ATPase|nr:ATP-binding protein [Bacteroidales bacterium]
MSNQINREQIQSDLREYCSRFDSQNKAAKTLKGVSAATVSQVLNNNWELIRESMWRTIQAQIGKSGKEWSAVETTNYKVIYSCLTDAQVHSNVLAVVGDAGTGKTYTSKLYAEDNSNTYLLCCNEFWNRKMFMAELLTAMGRDYSGLTVAEMMNEVVLTLKKTDRPLIIMDEADKLSDQVLYFFITLYNMLEDCCGLVLQATDHLEKRINRGLKLNKKGYKEIYSRIGRRFIELPGINSQDVISVAVKNGIEDKTELQDIVEECDWDLRRVKRKIHAIKQRA